MFKGRNSLDKNEHKGQKAKLLDFIDKNPQDVDSMFSLADIFEEEKNWQEALSWLTKCLKIDPHNMLFGLRKALILLDELEDVDSAFFLLKDLTAQFSLLSVEEIKQEWDEEVVLEILLMLIDCCRLKKLFHEALEIAQKAKIISSQDERVILALATAHFEVGEYKKALFLLEPVIALNKNSEFFWQKAQVHCANNEFDLAKEAFRIAHELEPEFHHIPEWLSKEEFKRIAESALLAQPVDIKDYLKNIGVEVMDIVPLEWIKQQKNLSPLALSTFSELKGIILFQKNIENICNSKDEIKSIIVGAMLCELEVLDEE